MDNDDVLNRVFDKLDRQDERLNTTCTTIAKIDQKLSDFIDAVNKKDEQVKQSIEKRYKIISVFFGSATSVSVLVGILKTFGLV